LDPSDPWNVMFGQLRAYRMMNGDCRVSYGHNVIVHLSSNVRYLHITFIACFAFEIILICLYRRSLRDMNRTSR
jgi:hypothetical protein